MKKFICLLLSIICIFTFVCGCSENKSVLTKAEPACLFEEGGLLCVQNAAGTWDFINTNGEVVVKTEYTIKEPSGEAFGDIGAAVLRNDYKSAILNSKGEELISFTNSDTEKYLIGTILECGLATVSKYRADNTTSCGVVTSKGKLLVDFIWERVKITENGYIQVQNTDGKWGVLDNTGKTIVEPAFDNDSSLPYFSNNGLAAKKEDGKYGYINTAGDWVIKPEYDHAAPFQPNGLAIIRIGSYYSVINEKGNIITTNSYDHIDNYSNGVAVVLSDKSYGLIDEKGKEVVDKKYSKIEVVSSGFAKVKLEEKYGYITLSGKEYIKCDYEKLGDVGSNGYVAAYDGSKWGYLDQKGKWAIEPIFQSAEEFIDGYAIVKDGQYGMIDEDGKIIIENKYDEIVGYTVNGIAAVRQDRKWELINKNGDVIGNIPNESLWYFPGDGFFVSINEETNPYYIIRDDGTIISSKLNKIAYNPNLNH